MQPAVAWRLSPIHLPVVVKVTSQSAPNRGAVAQQDQVAHVLLAIPACLTLGASVVTQAPQNLPALFPRTEFRGRCGSGTSLARTDVVRSVHGPQRVSRWFVPGRRVNVPQSEPFASEIAAVEGQASEDVAPWSTATPEPF